MLYLGWRGGGHVIVACGCFLVTYGIYLLPYAKPDLAHILGLPLFWGFFCLFGCICAIYLGFCHCIYGKANKCKVGMQPQD